MRILGLDPGSSATGYGIVESHAGRLSAVVQGTISPPRGLPFLSRLPYIAGALEELLEQQQPDVAAVEDVFIARDSRAALKLGQARGAALVPLLRSGLVVHEYAARLVKRTVAGYGGADKEQVRRMVKILLGLGTARLSFDASDALAIAICHAHIAAFRRIGTSARA
jgi:crossover junction endodeoxyribonuclease RuvC